VPLKDTPEGVQATIKKTTDAGATLEMVDLEEDRTEFDGRSSWIPLVAW
jgi:hypothetical protein